MVAAFVRGCEGPFHVHIDANYALDVRQLYPKLEQGAAPVETARAEMSRVVPAKPSGKSDINRIAALKIQAARKLTQAAAKAGRIAERSHKQAEKVIGAQFQKLNARTQRHLDVDLTKVVKLPQLAEEEEEDSGESDVENAKGDGNASEFTDAAGASEIDSVCGANQGSPQPGAVAVAQQPFQRSLSQSQPPRAEQQPRKAELGESAQPRASDWVRQLDPNSGEYYYWNTVTNETTWDEPQDFVALTGVGHS